MQEQPDVLKRTLNSPVLIFYGLGTIVGAGIYVLVGKVAAASGALLPYAFLLAGFIAAFTALSYSELAARYPQSAGAALYVERAYKRAILSKLVGWLVIFTGVVSAAAIVNGFHGYLSIFITLPPVAVKIGLALVLAAIAAWGIKESAFLITIITLVEIGGLLYVMFVGITVPSATAIAAAPVGSTSIAGLLLGSFLAFYAFIGFEDMVNVVEEVKKPRQTLPIAILVSVTLATLLYVLVALVAMHAVPMSELSSSEAPLATLVEKAGIDPSLIAGISLVAVVNGALVQVIMASRVMYGMSRKGLAPEALGHVNSVTQTPVPATVLVVFIVLALALWLPIDILAGLTSFVMLAIFTAVNLGLVVIKRRKEAAEGFAVPIWVPAFGAVLCLFLIGYRLMP